MRLANKLCVVTGASTGIGAALARALADDGAAVVGFARRFAGEPVRPAGGDIAEVGLDITREADVRARFDAIGAVDVLVNNAGVGAFGRFEDLSLTDLRAMLDTHVVGTFLCTREALRTMRPAGRGHVVNIASTAAIETFPDCAGYTAAKLGQVGLSRVLAEEARAYGVRVTTVIPGAVDTPIWDDRPGFDRSAMMRPAELAGLVVDVVARPDLAVDELVVRPPAGNL